MVSVRGMGAIKKSTGKQGSGFTAEGLKFLADLKKNNKREWFQPRKEKFDELLHDPLVELAELVNGMLMKAAPEYSMPEPGKALNRIYRDVRFSKDKKPYNDHVSFLFPNQRLGKKTGAGLYFHLSADEAMVGGGMYFGGTRELQLVREQLAEKHAEFRKIVAGKKLKERYGELFGEGLQKSPKQFGVDHPAADLLKMKQWLLLRRFPADAVLEEGFAASAVKDLELLVPFVRFLNGGLGGLV